MFTMGNDSKKVEILPEDKVQLTQDQKNLIEMALEKQLPVEDAEFLERVQKSSKNPTQPYIEIHKFFALKYGVDFGTIYLSSITNGEAGYKQTIRAIEEDRAMERVGNQKKS